MAGKLVIVARFPTPVAAKLAQNLLDDEGITSSLEGENIVGTAWYLGNAVGDVKVLVDEEDAVRAEDVLNAQNNEWGSTATDSRSHDSGLEDDEGPVPELPECDQAIERAFRAAVFGMLFFPPLLHFYSIRCLLGAVNLPGELNPRLRWKLATAWLIDIVFVILGSIVWGAVFFHLVS